MRRTHGLEIGVWQLRQNGCQPFCHAKPSQMRSNIFEEEIRQETDMKDW